MYTFPLDDGVSPRRPQRRLDLPHPTGPTTIVIFPGGKSIEMSLITGLSSSDQASVKFLTLMTAGDVFALVLDIVYCNSTPGPVAVLMTYVSILGGLLGRTCGSNIR
jgi:hypothetical protein